MNLVINNINERSADYYSSQKKTALQETKTFKIKDEVSRAASAKILWNSLRQTDYVKLPNQSLHRERDGSWDRYAVARFTDMISKTTGSTLDAHVILQRYDINGDGILNRDEQSAMILSLTQKNKGFESKDIEINNDRKQSQFIALSEWKKHESIKRYENFFWYEDELAVI